ncbi:hypothetical protein PanWU01x14_279340 [Parasponia andersonii]|uniref:Uncharacterized protein n=1 Tax=Parasponia andersonii TaxID=3476 RepID=A0A2P5B1R4_PARAD|nr:hypothetical protein PanWU01x14_279340 [Parasponia andersonii]
MAEVMVVLDVMEMAVVAEIQAVVSVGKLPKPTRTRNGRRRNNVYATIFDESPPLEYRNLHTAMRLGLVGHLNVVRPLTGVETLSDLMMRLSELRYNKE